MNKGISNLVSLKSIRADMAYEIKRTL